MTENELHRLGMINAEVLMVVKRAHWIYRGKSDGHKIYECSNCHSLINGMSNYCKECGSIMDGEKQ